ncbi:50S ribosomal protein L2 [Candidatus Saccharibacteria bacterium RIFCSPHIGHO2_12_FULL_49_19]|nr:MAG: 50S ribosomal protein L2 [Candidatus Saccharibacteria bacterium RIFCSPHIGHO2_01_FULL_49_21]OGL37796.1 MAG: 50S ribosomal protein L2 [Candidatus Saccharibacteria bacterium RIFCSPHIGHO2_12_FULL_49_19]OGL38587.1 MAG: 50S ribosomal protein L2 [Candidatus Saccharibacteria bacterium RIFCSPLOWO2_01_FULL_49_22]
MAIKTYRPTTPARRQMTSQDFSAITAKKPLKSLTKIKKTGVARNSQGRITTRHRGGGARRYYRVINFKLPTGTTATVEAIEYDPNRSARIARIKDQDGRYHYILAPAGIRAGSKLVAAEETAIKKGNRLPLKSIPLGTIVHGVELQPGRGAQLARAAGAKSQLIAKEGNYAQIRLPSGEIRMVGIEGMATVGSVGNEQHQNVVIGKAGRSRRMGIRPTVRGVVMAAADHPHGGGDGGKHRMARPPTTPWGQKTLGYKTRRRKVTSKFIVRSRHQSKRR